MDLSILIASYNSEKYIKRCLDSIFNYLNPNELQFEVLIKDGDSTDGTLDIIKNYVDKLPIKFFSSPDDGIYNAMNFELAHASGKWVYFMGSDDVLLEGINDLLLLAVDDSYDLIYGNVFLKHEQRRYDGEFTLKKLFVSPPPHQGTIFRKSLFQNYGYYIEQYFICGDYERYLLFFSKPEIKKKYYPTTVAIFNDNGFSRSGPKDILFARDRANLIKEYYDITKFDSAEKHNFALLRRKDAIMVIDDGRFFWLGMTRYIQTIKLSDNPFLHARYLLGSIKNHISKRFKKKKSKDNVFEG